MKGALLVNGQLVPGSFLIRPSASQGTAEETIASFAGACHDLLRFTSRPSGRWTIAIRSGSGLPFRGPSIMQKALPFFKASANMKGCTNCRFGICSVRSFRASNHLSGCHDESFDRCRYPVRKRRLHVRARRVHPVPGGTSPMPNARHGPRLCLCGEWPDRSRQGRYPWQRHAVCRALPGPHRGQLFREKRHSEDGLGRGLLTDGIDVADLAEAATRGNVQACDLFREYGSNLGGMLRPYLSGFRPNRLVLGGQISGSLPLWERDMQLALGTHAVPIDCLEDGTAAVFYGIEKLFDDTASERSAPYYH